MPGKTWFPILCVDEPLETGSTRPGDETGNSRVTGWDQERG